MAANMADLLQLMVDRGASDLHITSGTYPQIRVSGRLTQLTQFEVLDAAGHQRLSYSVLNEGQNRSSRKRTSSTSRSVSRGSRASVATSIGSAGPSGARSASSRTDRTFDELRDAQIVQQLADRAKGLILYGMTRIAHPTAALPIDVATEAREPLDTEREVELVLFLELLFLALVQDAVREPLGVLRRQHLELGELGEATADADLRIRPAGDVQVRRAPVHHELQKIGHIGRPSCLLRRKCSA